MAHDEPWYHYALFYLVDIKSSCDGDGDGLGDFGGLAEKVPYRAKLGVTCLRVTPVLSSARPRQWPKC